MTRSSTRPLTMGSMLLIAALGACGGSDAPPPAGPGPAPMAVVPGASATDAERMFPLRDRYLYTFERDDDKGSGVVTFRVSRASATQGSLLSNGPPQQFTYTAEGVVQGVATAAPVYLLKWPLVVGNQWKSERGGTVTITEVEVTANVPAGTYNGCVKTLEKRSGDVPMQVTTTFCPEVGIVKLESASGDAFIRHTLKSYGPPVDLGPDGVRVVPPGGQ